MLAGWNSTDSNSAPMNLLSLGLSFQDLEDLLLGNDGLGWRGNGVGGANEFIDVVYAGGVPAFLVLHKLLLARLRREVAAHIVSIGFGLEHRREVDARPDLLTRILSLLFDSLHGLVKTVCADDAHAEEVVGRTEAAEGKVAAILDRLIAAGGRKILDHGK